MTTPEAPLPDDVERAFDCLLSCGQFSMNFANALDTIRAHTTAQSAELEQRHFTDAEVQAKDAELESLRETLRSLQRNASMQHTEVSDYFRWVARVTEMALDRPSASLPPRGCDKCDNGVVVTEHGGLASCMDCLPEMTQGLEGSTLFGYVVVINPAVQPDTVVFSDAGMARRFIDQLPRKDVP